MHLKIVLYFWHIVVSGMLSGLSLAIAGTLYFEGMMLPIPLFMGVFALSFSWFVWRLIVQQKYKFLMTKKAFKTYLPLCLITIATMTLGSKKLLAVMMESPPRIQYLLYVTAIVAGMGVCAKIVDFEYMASKEKITYKKQRSHRRRRSSTPSGTAPRSFQS